MMNENAYGHLKRLRWIVSHRRGEDRVVEIGCGTGRMIALPLALMGYRLIGVDPDGESIAFGQELFRRSGIDPGILRKGDMSSIDFLADVVIASEVIEHLCDRDLVNGVNALRHMVKQGGKLLVTVPSGYGWFELESLLWSKARLGKLFERARVDTIYRKLKKRFFGPDVEDFTPSTLSASPHVQRFTYRSIQRYLEDSGFEIIDSTGSVFFAGPFSNLFFTGIGPAMRLNCLIGSCLPTIASGFYIACRRR